MKRDQEYVYSHSAWRISNRYLLKLEHIPSWAPKLDLFYKAWMRVMTREKAGMTEGPFIQGI